LGLSAEERSELLPSGKQTVFSNRVHWAKTYLTQAALIENTMRGHFGITPRGEQILASHPSHIDNAFLRQFDEFKQFKERARVSQSKPPDVQAEVEETNETETPDEIMRRAHKQINAALAQDLLEHIRAASPEFFERLIVDLLLSMGYGGSRADKAGRILGRSGDDGVDGVIDQDALGLDRVYIQAKRYAAGNNIGSGAIRDFFGSLDRHKAKEPISQIPQQDQTATEM
jgi:restriction system protein